MSAERSRSEPLFGLLGAATGFVGVLAARRVAELVAEVDAVEVDGVSMVPTLLPGERLLVESRSFRTRSPRRGDLVLASDPRAAERELVKRVAEVSDGRVELRGDAAASTDSRAFGSLPAEQVRWRVWFRYWPPSRIGPIR